MTHFFLFTCRTFWEGRQVTQANLPGNMLIIGPLGKQTNYIATRRVFICGMLSEDRLQFRIAFWKTNLESLYSQSILLGNCCIGYNCRIHNQNSLHGWDIWRILRCNTRTFSECLLWQFRKQINVLNDSMALFESQEIDCWLPLATFHRVL